MKKNIPLIYALAIALVVISTNSYGRAASALSANITAFHNVTCNGGTFGWATVTATGGSAPYTYLWLPSGGTNMTASNLSAGTYTVKVTDAASATATALVNITQPSPLVASIGLNPNGGTLTAIVNVSGISGYSGDGGPASAAEVYAPTSVTTDKYRNIYICDWDNRRIREVNATTGVITTIAGNGVTGYSGDGGPATACEFTGATDASVDSSGNLWIADYLDNAVRVITNSTTNPWPNNINGGNPTQPGYIYLFNTANYLLIQNIFFDPAGNMYLVDQGLSGKFLIVTNSTFNPWPTIINGGNPTVAGATYTMASGGLRYQGVIFDKTGNLYYTSLDYPYIYVITKSTTNPWPALINSGNPTTPGQTYIMYTLPTPMYHSVPGATWLAFDKYQNLYVADYYSNQIYVVPWQGGSNSGYAFVDSKGDAGYTAYGYANTGFINSPNSCMIDNDNNMYLSDCPDPPTIPNSGIHKIVIGYSRDEPCYGYSIVSATASGSGGTSPYTYKWSTGETANSVSGLSAGAYTVTVTDNNGCTAHDTITINQPGKMTIAHDSVSQIGPCNGLAAVTIGGATAPYTYLWTMGNKTTDTIKGLCAGTYCCYIYDNNGCPDSTCVTVNLATGIQNMNDTLSIIIYPNPFTNSTTISIIDNGHLTMDNYLELDDITGRKLNQIEFKGNTYTLSATGLAKGMYFIRIFDKDKNAVGASKIVVQ